jgi:peroxiredoxin family protein
MEVKMDEEKKSEKLTIVLHSGDMDKAYSALIIANGALAMGMEASIFFTFWGLQRLRKDKAFAFPPAGLEKGPLSKMNFLGLGKWMIKRRMKKANVVSLEKLMADFKELGGKVIACDMTMEIMGIKPEDLRQEWIDECGGVGGFIQEARESGVVLFI